MYTIKLIHQLLTTIKMDSFYSFEIEHYSNVKVQKSAWF
jgi:hypothetical protein